MTESAKYEYRVYLRGHRWAYEARHADAPWPPFTPGTKRSRKAALKAGHAEARRLRNGDIYWLAREAAQTFNLDEPAEETQP